MMLFILMLINIFPVLPLNMFTIYAEVEKSNMIQLPFDYIDRELRDLSIYQKYFPSMIEVKRLDDTKTSWTYEVDMPLAKAVRTTYVLEERRPSKGVVIFETLNSSADYMFCMATIISHEPSKTELKIKMILKTTRESGSDIHFLAPIMGQKFISAQMKERLEEDLQTFLDKATNDLYTGFNNSKQ